MKCSDIIAKKIESLTDFAFTGQGGSVVHILDSLKRVSNVKIIPSQNEQGASMAADAYTRATDKIGVVIATSGPGILNALQGMACSYYDSVPSLYISGAPVTSALKKNKNIRQVGFQEMDIPSIVNSFCKYVVRIMDPRDVIYEIDKAIDIATSGRPGPVVIDLPDDIQRMDISENDLKKFNSIEKKEDLKLDESKFSEFVSLLENSKRPLFIFGNGIKISKTENLCQQIVNKFNIPYAPTWASYDLFNSDDELNVGSFGMYATRHGNFSVENSDLLIILGSRPNGTLTGSKKQIFSSNSKKIQVDIDENELNLGDGFHVDIKFNSDVKIFLKRLLQNDVKLNNFDKWKKKINEWKEKYPIILDEYKNQTKNVNPYLFFDKLSELTKEGDIIIPDASANLVWTYQAYKSKKNQKIFTALNHSPMGYSVPAAIGPALTTKKNVIAIIGDGSMQMNIQEIENIKAHNLNIKIFLINNFGYGMVKQTIDTWLDGNYVGCDTSSGLSLPDFSKVFNSYGIKTLKINNHNEMHDIIDTCLNLSGPVMCEVIVNEKQRIIPKTKAGSPLHDMLPKLSDEEIESNIIK
jgi:acetolactate synthase-1/2/3 large subunit